MFEVQFLNVHFFYTINTYFTLIQIIFVIQKYQKHQKTVQNIKPDFASVSKHCFEPHRESPFTGNIVIEHL